jgi:hypothetical protein
VVAPKDIKWEMLPAVMTVVAPIRRDMGEDTYQTDKEALQSFLCNYFNSDDGKDCRRRQHTGIAPMGGTTNRGGKCLKVRWRLPGQGKSGGLRLAVVAYCKEKRVKLAGAWVRKDDPSDDDFNEAFAKTP